MGLIFALTQIHATSLTSRPNLTSCAKLLRFTEQTGSQLRTSFNFACLCIYVYHKKFSSFDVKVNAIYSKVN